MANQATNTKFGFLKTIKLDNLGEPHKDDYLKFEEVTFKEGQELADAQQAADAAREKLQNEQGGEEAAAKQKKEDDRKATEYLIKLLKNKFIEGEVYNEKTDKKVTVEVNDLENLPMRAVTKAAKELSGGTDENLDGQ